MIEATFSPQQMDLIGVDRDEHDVPRDGRPQGIGAQPEVRHRDESGDDGENVQPEDVLYQIGHEIQHVRDVDEGLHGAALLDGGADEDVAAALTPAARARLVTGKRRALGG